MGLFITLEGIEGAGKSTISRFIYQWFKRREKDVLLTREPGGTNIGESIRDILLHKKKQNILPETELLLMFCARIQHLKTVIEPALIAKKVVVLDRFTDASYAYQGGGRGVPAERISMLEKWAHPNLQPDLTFLLDIDVKTIDQRITTRGEIIDRFEMESLDFFQRVRDEYLYRAQAEPNRFVVIDADHELSFVKKEINKQLTKRFS